MRMIVCCDKAVGVFGAVGDRVHRQQAGCSEAAHGSAAVSCRCVETHRGLQQPAVAQPAHCQR